MAYIATPILYLNMGGEMLYVLQQRLQTQRISPDKSNQVLNDVIYAMLNPHQLQPVFEPGPILGLAWLRPQLERVVLSSIMRLDAGSMGKLFDLMTMMCKYQLETATGPRELILATLHHLDAARDMAVDSIVKQLVEHAQRLVVDTYGPMTYKEIWQIRGDCLKEIQHHNVRVSILLRLGMQNDDATFNRLIQRYDEKYNERREILENFKLIDYQEDENVAGSLSPIGNRVTLLGKNVYSCTYGQLQGSGTPQNLHQFNIESNKCVRDELDTLATQLGQEETSIARPFSLHLFKTYDANQNVNMVSDDTELDQNITSPTEDDHGNIIKNDDDSISEYKNSLMNNINSDFADNDLPRAGHSDLMNFLNM
ncbi:hypothetical protein QAD02_023073 [Eretmocerus hayati]|uniref:Uncharacterized protein n=1 Tax=Eretmocerus hayati TaxID=131215 RepID=A0ACC2PUL2_9HYME|nr:hypothetical protein QAD02_023073 [Eretmocerus hayati]